MSITYHSGERGRPGALVSFTGTDGVTHNAVIEARVITDDLGNVLGTSGNPLVTSSGAGSNQIQGTVANAAADSGNPVKIGGVSNVTAPTLVANGNRVDAWYDQRGATMASLASAGVLNAFNVAPADAVNASFSAYNFVSRNYAFNGTTFDRTRTITGAIADGTGLGVAAVEQAGSAFSNITTATTTTVKSGKGILHKIAINTYVASATITIYDNTVASGTKIATLTLPVTITSDVPMTLPYDLQFSTGLTIVTSGATDITVVYR